MLTTAHMSSHAATHVRSMIEALVTMKMLELKSDYVQQMRYERIRGEKRVYEAVLADPHLSDGVKQPIRERLASCKPEYDRLHATGVRPKRIVDEFGAAGLSHLVGPYAMLCNFTHNDLAALAFRHGDERKMVYRNDDSPQLIQAILSSAVQVLMVATYQLGELAAFTDGHFETVFNEMNAHWHTILDQPVVQGVE